MQGGCVLVLSFRCQPVCRFRETNLLILAAADLGLVIWFSFFILCFHVLLRYTAVRRQQRLATFLAWRMFSFASLMATLLLLTVGFVSLSCVPWVGQGCGSFGCSRNSLGKQPVSSRSEHFPSAGICYGLPRPRRFSVQPRRGRTCPPLLFAGEERLQRGMPHNNKAVSIMRVKWLSLSVVLWMVLFVGDVCSASTRTCW